MLDYKLIEAFAAVIAEGGFEKAAKVLHITQSAISQRVKLLEEQTGCILLIRSSPPQPTAAGKEVLKHYRQVRQLEADLDTELGHSNQEFSTLRIGLNADSLATWFFPAIQTYISANSMLLDLAVDDQAETHKLLRNGEVLGCISDQSTPIQGCQSEYLGKQVYKLYSTEEYKLKWFKEGVTLQALNKAPILVFNRKDRMHIELLTDILGEQPQHDNAFYLPSSEKFATVIASGHTCGMLPDQQAAEYLARDELVDLLPMAAFTVNLYWHCWNIHSNDLKRFTAALIAGATRELT